MPAGIEFQGLCAETLCCKGFQYAGLLHSCTPYNMLSPETCILTGFLRICGAKKRCKKFCWYSKEDTFVSVTN